MPKKHHATQQVMPRMYKPGIRKTIKKIVFSQKHRVNIPQGNMAKRFSFEIRIITVLIAVLILVAAIGILAFRSLYGIVADVKDATEPNSRITLLKQVITDLSDAEGSVKTYRLTGDDNYLDPFYASISSVDERMQELHRQSKGSDEQENLADSVQQLVEIKYEILNKFLLLEDNENVTGELKKISIKLKQAELKQAKTTEANKEKHSGIFQKIFGVPTKETTPAPLNLSDVKREVERVKIEQAKQLQALKQTELSLSRDDKLAMDKIRSVVQKMENNEKTANARKAIKIAKNAKETNFFIVLFCVVVTILLGVISYIIVSYVQKNKAYRLALRNAKTQAENLAKTRESFLANMSHEIRTPMNAIAGFTSQVLQTKLTATQNEQLGIVKKSADHLLRIINDILDYSKIQSGKFSFDAVGFGTAGIISEVATLLKPSANQKQLELKYQVSSSVPEVLKGDPMRLRQILLNIVGNAIKFTETGSITIKAAAIPQENNICAVQITVDDTGVGISAENIRKIFDEFEQADNNVARKYGGTGLGLTITRKLVELQNGTIDISSTPGHGTKINIIIPYAIGTPADIEADTPKVITSGRLDDVNALVADDEIYNRLLIETVLKKWGVNVTLVTNGEEAVNEVKKNNYDIVLMDLRMPVLSGIEATKKIKQLKNTKKAAIPIIALTATTQKTDVEECLQAGMVKVISKPFNEAELFVLIQQLLQPDAAPVIEHTISTNAAPAVPNGKRFDLEELKHLSNGDTAFVTEMVNVFITTTQEGLQNMDIALAAQEWDNLADYAHKIVPPCRHLKANTLLKLLKTIELQIRDEGKTEGLETLVAQAKQEAEEIIELLREELPA
jgi:signal transduction histidine kinase/CheY-like chemotaxis protein/HPt (histidine-containing phosphotransfer) domain-containing protein